jgi:SAM-dependent methyltransferase
MTDHFSHVDAAFDEYAGDYEGALSRGISVSGEDRIYFARGRIAWLARRLAELGESPASVMDLGCGTGAATPFLLDIVGATSVLGIDVSAKSLEAARAAYDPERTRFALLEEYRPNGGIDLAFCNGAFHHIPPPEQPGTLSYVFDSLRRGGLFALWENNAWNPGARLVMSRIPFDRDAIMLSPGRARRLLRAAGFDILRTDFLFIFPRFLRPFRSMEPWLSRLPLGAQYQVLCRKPN